MKRSGWRTGPPIKHVQPVPRLSGGQLLKQLVILLVILLVWGGGFFLWSSMTSAGRASAVTAVTATPTTASAPTQTSTAPATDAPAPSATPRPTQPAATATSVPTVAPTSTSAPAATPAPVETPTSIATAENPAAAGISFQRDVQPIFNQICVKCHGGEEVREGLNLTSYTEVMQGSDNGAVIVPGDAANSLLAQQVESGKMPKRGPKLLPKQIQAIVDWINAGAPDN
jgi:mono/diheme cytochrome c family protein